MGRSTYLKLQFIPLFLYIPTAFAHIIFFSVKGVEWCHEIYLKEDEDEEEEWNVLIKTAINLYINYVQV